MNGDVAAWIVDGVLGDLKNRQGFDNFWDGIDGSTRREITDSLEHIVQDLLDANYEDAE